MNNPAEDSIRIARAYMDSLQVESRLLGAEKPSSAFEFLGETFSTPIMTAALSHIDLKGMAEGAVLAGAAVSIGMGDNETLKGVLGTGAKVMKIVKPYANRDDIRDRIRFAEANGAIAVGIDIDHVFANDGSPCICFGEELRALTTAELADICKASKLPVIAKGVLSAYDAEETLKAGVQGMVLSHHHNRIEFAVAPLQVLPVIAKIAEGSIPLFVDCMIQTGMDAFKALALGATAVGIGRPLMTAIKNDPENGVRDYLLKANQELAKAMAYTGCTDLSRIDPSVIHFRER